MFLSRQPTQLHSLAIWLLVPALAMGGTPGLSCVYDCSVGTSFASCCEIDAAPAPADCCCQHRNDACTCCPDVASTTVPAAGQCGCSFQSDPQATPSAPNAALDESSSVAWQSFDTDLLVLPTALSLVSRSSSLPVRDLVIEFRVLRI